MIRQVARVCGIILVVSCHLFAQPSQSHGVAPALNLNLRLFMVEWAQSNSDNSSITLSESGLVPGRIFSYANEALSKQFQDLVLIRTYVPSDKGTVKVLVSEADHASIAIPGHEKIALRLILACMSVSFLPPPQGLNNTALIPTENVFDPLRVIAFQSQHREFIDNFAATAWSRVPPPSPSGQLDIPFTRRPARGGRASSRGSSNRGDSQRPQPIPGWNRP